MKMKVIVIGNTGLCLECCKLIVDSPMHELLAVITNDLKLKQWGNQHQIKLLTYAEYQQSDYKNYILLSIVNERIISQAFIERHRIIHAINYHDSLLPTYAGVNSTAWAILNNESSHGVTWHKITQGIDEGDIIQQAKIAITPEDTAHSLNLKCTQQTIVLFKKLLLELSSHTLKGKTQDLTHKTYYGLDHLPQNYGFINTCQSLEDIYRYCRALYFGNDYPNQITSVKIKLENTVYLLGMPVFADAPQTLSDVIGLYIVADEKALHFTTVRNIYGMEVNLSTIVSIEKLGLHKVEFSHHDWHQLKAIKKNEQKQINNALKIAYKANPIVSKATNNNNITKSATCNHSIECQNLSTQQVVSAISLVLMRVAQQDEFLIHFYTNDNCSSHLASLIDSKCFIELSHNNLELPLKDFENLINENLNTKHLLAKDFYYRYQTMNLLTDIGIYHHSSLTYLTDLTHFTDHLTPHRLNFIFDNNSIKMISRDTDILEINAIASSLQVIINQYQQHSKKNTKPNNISLLSKDDYQKIVIDWNKTDKPYPKNKTIHQLFEEQVEKHPNNIAVIFEKKQLTYAQLNAKANQLARYLRSITSIQPDTFIAIALDKSLEMIIGILGILKSGAAYVPIDTSYPDERLKYILDDTQAALVLSQSQYVSRLQDISKASILALDSDCYKSLSIQNLTSISTANNLAYVIYTSGTTGQPKGVMIEHSSLVNMTYSQQENLKISEASRILQFASIGFDASVWEIFGALSFGSRLNILSNAKKSQLKYLENYLLFNEISHATLPPKLIENLDIKFLPKYLCSAGEALNAKTLQKLIGKECFINAYGLTEASVCSTIYKYNRDSLNKNIGKSIDNNKCYVVDVYNNPVPIGVIGELYIGGAGLARGYLNKPELTAEKFIPNPFATETDKANGYDHLYKTGDLVRWLPDGNLEYIGRKDTQIKIRGFRIELAEIESTLINITGIQQAVVINRAINSEQYLFAYYTAKEQTNPELILDKLTKKLPHYMIPSAALQINDIPLTINGKIDIYALPDIGFESTQAYIEPRTEQERIVCQAFSNLLLIEKIGIDDDFFKLGGNSVKAIQLAMVLQSNLEVDIAEIFDLRTPRKLAHNKRITHDLLISKLEQIKYEYISQPIKEHEKLNPTQLLKKEQYLSQITNMPAVKYTAKPIQNVLLTGATGFLGCNLLNQLLTLTSYCIYLCIRAKDKTHAIERMAHKYQFYFDISLEDHFADRIVYIPCDLEKRQIGVSDEQYHQLTKNIDSIIHCAALAKHYGIEQVFYKANVTSTINLLKLCELTNLKDFHYISSYSVMTGIANDNETILTEDDQLSIDAEWNSPYTKTKYLGEINTIKWREKGINSSVYRVGNLAFMQRNGKIQEDVKDNAFATYITFIRKLGYIPDNMNDVEISPADITATAIVKMFDKPELNNQTHHLFNPNKIKLSQMLSTKNQKLKVMTFESFIDKLIIYLQHNDDCDLIGRFLLRMGWQSDTKKSYFNINRGTTILQSKTEAICKMINFQWSVINSQQLTSYVMQLDCVFNVHLNTNKYFSVQKYMIDANKGINSAKLKVIALFKSHKKIISVVGTLFFIAPVIYILELLDIITILEFLDTTV